MREKIIVHIEDGERTLAFSIQQMSAWKLEKWMYKAFILLARAGGSEIDGFSIAEAQDAIKKVQRSTKGDASALETVMRIVGGLDFEDAEPLLDSLFECVRLIPDESTGIELKLDRPVIEGNIESPLTLMKLRVEVLKLNFGFFQKGKKHQKEEAPAIMFKKPTRTFRR